MSNETTTAVLPAAGIVRIGRLAWRIWKLRRDAYAVEMLNRITTELVREDLR